MKTILKSVFVTDDGSEFIDKIDAARHERSEQAMNEIERLLFGGRGMSGPRMLWGDDLAIEFAMSLASWMVERPTSTKLLEILRQLEEDIPATGLDPKGRNVKT